MLILLECIFPAAPFVKLKQPLSDLRFTPQSAHPAHPAHSFLYHTEMIVSQWLAGKLQIHSQMYKTANKQQYKQHTQYTRFVVKHAKYTIFNLIRNSYTNSITYCRRLVIPA